MLKSLPNCPKEINIPEKIKQKYIDCPQGLPTYLLIHDNKRIIGDIKYGYYVVMLNLAPYDMSGTDLCKHSTKGCESVCLATVKQGEISSDKESNQDCRDFGKIKRTLLYLNYKDYFFDNLVYYIIKYYEKKEELDKKLKMAIRLNGYSDIIWEDEDLKITSESIQKKYKSFMQEEYGKEINDYSADNIFKFFPDIDFYDYTKYDPIKDERDRTKLPKNYHLTFSLSERKIDKKHIDEILKFENIAIVVPKQDKKQIIEYINQSTSYTAIDGDLYDCRIIDGENKLVILEAIEDATRIQTNFVKSLSDVKKLLNSK